MMSLQYAMLGLLNYKAMTGYELKKMFDESIRHFWAASLSQIYRELGALEKRGCLTSVIETQNDRPDKRIYTVTEDGRAEFKEWITTYPEKLSKETRDEFLLRMFFGSHLTKEELTCQFRRFLKEKQDHLEEIGYLHQISDRYVREMELFNGEEFYWKFILRRAQLNLGTSIQWAKECLDDLEKKGIGERVNATE